MKHVETLDISRKSFYVHFPFHPYAKHNDHPYDWLVETEGGEFTFGGHGIYFYNEKDAVLFTLRWAHVS